MSIDFITELENKVDKVLQTVEQLRSENAKIKGELEKKSESLKELEEENRSLQNELLEIRSKTQDNSDKLKYAAEKIQSLIAKIEAV